LQDDSPAGTADQDIDAEARTQRYIAARAYIASAQGAGADARIPGENGPGQHACAGRAEVDTDPPDPSYIDVLLRRISRMEYAAKRLL
jgi:hypothetical protein